MRKGIALSICLSIMTWVLLQPKPLLRWIAERDPRVLYYVQTSERLVALTIDDGPHPTVTPMILRVLSKYHAHATFFLIGERVQKNEGIVHQILSEGHEIGNHMMTDATSIRLPAAAFEDQLLRADRLLSRFAAARWFRPGSARYNERMLRQVKRQNYRCVIGSVFPYDTHVPSVRFQSAFILSKVFPGSIVILHEGDIGRKRVAQVLDDVIPQLQSRGYRVVSLSELVEAQCGS